MFDNLENFNRLSLHQYCIDKFNYKIGIEIGVREGFFCCALLNETKIEKLYGLDKERYVGIANLEKLYKNRFIFLNERSPDKAKDFIDGFFDFIHIDAEHGYEDVKPDLNGWWPKLKKGGLFSGDDYISHPHYGVIKAVDQFEQEKNIKILITGVKNQTKENQHCFANNQWTELQNKVSNHSNDFSQIPCWFCIKGT